MMDDKVVNWYCYGVSLIPFGFSSIPSPLLKHTQWGKWSLNKWIICRLDVSFEEWVVTNQRFNGLMHPYILEGPINKMFRQFL